MKIKNFLLKLSIMILAVVSLMFGTVSVHAVREETAVNTAVAEQTDYYDNGYYDDYYDGYYDEYDDNVPYYSNRLSHYDRPVNWFRIIGMALLISIAVTVAVVSMIYRGYKHNGKTEPYPYNNKAPLELTDTEDILVDTDIRRERIERERR